jgi:hypothetical protein
MEGLNNYYGMSLSHVNNLEGFKTVFKNFHWSASDLTFHKVIDDFLSELSDYQDDIAETSQGYLEKQYGIGEIVPTRNTFSCPCEALQKLNAEVADFFGKIAEDDDLVGVANAVNDFQQQILKYKYLFNLARKDKPVNAEGNPQHEYTGLMNVMLE